MKIDKPSTGVSGLPPSADSRNRAASNVKGPTSSPTEVQLSALSASLQKAESAIAQSPVVSSSRVNEIRQAIADGQFEIHPERIADGLINSVREMLTGSAAIHP